MPKTASLPEGHDTGTRSCAMPGCIGEGQYPAPRDRRNLRDYLWLCLDHVRAYNKSWNYFDGLEGAALEAEIRKATTWERPSWKFGTAGPGPAAAGQWPDFQDEFGFFGPADNSNPAYIGMDKEEREAWQVIGMEPVSDPILIKQRYNELAKRYHPDHNGHDQAAEEKLKKINLAYSVLRKKRLNPQSGNQ